MPGDILSSPRKFEVWRYTVTHGQLLLRSNKGRSEQTRIEVLFRDVAFMALGPLMHGLVISEIASTSTPPGLKDVQSSRPWYCLRTEGWTGYVSAGSLTVAEDERGFEEPSYLLSDPFL